LLVIANGEGDVPMWEDERCLSHVLPYHMFFFFNNVVNYVSAFGITVIFGVAYGYYG